MTEVALVAHWDWVLYNFRLPLARRLRELGADVALVSPPGEYVPRLEAAGFRWLRWDVERRSLNPVAEAAAVARLARLYHREGFRAVHHFTIKPVLYGSLAARVAGVPWVFNSFTGLGFLFSHGPAPSALRAVALPVLRWALRNGAVTNIFQSSSDRDRFVQANLVSPSCCRVIAGTGVNVRRFVPGPFPEGPPAALVGARLLWDKGIGEFVWAAERLRARGVAGRFLVAGAPDPGNPRCIPSDQIARWSREGVVEFLGSQEDMPALLRRAHIAVLPSYYEGVPRFLLEAAATGLPLVGSDIPGCRMVIEPGVNGLLVPPRDPGALADALEHLILDASLRQAMGHASRVIAVERFDERVILVQFEAVYRERGLTC